MADRHFLEGGRIDQVVRVVVGHVLVGEGRHRLRGEHLGGRAVDVDDALGAVEVQLA
ncbi:hypothetical protein D3C87_2036290 [compost metagenome]